MAKLNCKTEDEVNQIILELQNENPNLDETLIRNAISSCCVQTEIVKNHETFIGCVKERIKMLRLM
jgi:hypothetical protein